MYQYIVQFRQVCVATTQINSTIKHIFLSCQPLVACQNLSPTQTRDPIYHPHKTFNFSDKSIPSFSVWKPQMKLEWKDSRDIQGIFTEKILNYESLDWIIQFL